jgi:hypothetical protein
MHGEQPVIAGKKVKISTYVRRYGKPKKTTEAMPFGPLDDEEVDILDREDVETAIGLVIELDSDPEDLRGFVAERARQLGHDDLIPQGWGMPTIISRPEDAFAVPVTVTESTSTGIATGYSLGAYATAYRLSPSDPNLCRELAAIGTRIAEAGEEATNDAVVQTYRKSLEKRIRAGIVAKAVVDNEGSFPDPDEVDLLYQQHFALAVDSVVSRASSALGVSVAESDDDEDDEDDEIDDAPVEADPEFPEIDDDEELSEADDAAGKPGKVPKYIFGRLNKEWKPSNPKVAERRAKVEQLLAKARELIAANKGQSTPEVKKALAAVRSHETARETRARRLARKDRLKARIAAGETKDKYGRDLQDRLHRVNRAIRKSNQIIGDRPGGPKKPKAAAPAPAAPDATKPAESPKPKKAKQALSGRDRVPVTRATKTRRPASLSGKPGLPSRKRRQPKPVVEGLQVYLRMAEARLEEHPGNHDQRVHSPTGRAAIALEKGGSRVGGQTPAMLQAEKKALMASKAKQVTPKQYRQGVSSAIAGRNKDPEARKHARDAILFARQRASGPRTRQVMVKTERSRKRASAAYDDYMKFVKQRSQQLLDQINASRVKG